MSGSRPVVQAAGGVLWRGTGDDVEVALVHRPAYDDWSIPKGKLRPGEHPISGALREVEEETGHEARLGQPLGETAYQLPDGRGKRVRYWSMEARRRDLPFTANGEVDDLCWLRPDDALNWLQPRREQPVLRAFLGHRHDRTLATHALVLVRHASAGERSAWRGDDAERPLDERGRSQAEELVRVLRGYGATRVVSADVTRCVRTVQPFAAAAGLAIEQESYLSEQGFPAHPVEALDRLVRLASGPDVVVACTQRKVLPELLRGMSEAFGADVANVRLRKGAFCVLHLVAGTTPRAVAAEQFDI